MPKTALAVCAPPTAKPVRTARLHSISRFQQFYLRWQSGRRMVRKNTVYATHERETVLDRCQSGLRASGAMSRFVVSAEMLPKLLNSGAARVLPCFHHLMA